VQRIGAPGAELPLECVDLSSVPGAEHPAHVAAVAARLHEGLDLAAGPLVRAALFDSGDGRPQRLLVVVHHLAVDGVSWRILLEELETLCGALERGETATLPAKTTSFARWTALLREHAASEAARGEAAFWRAEAAAPAPSLPVDRADGPDTLGSARTVVVALGEEETRALLHRVPQAYRTQVNDVLLTALVEAFAGWTGARSLRLALEGHGREELFEGVDLSRTVGWFTSIYPVRLGLEGVNGEGAALRAVKEQLRAVPRRGIGYGVLRYLSDDRELRDALARAPEPDVGFNYLGQLDRAPGASGRFRRARESSGPPASLHDRRPRPIDVNAGVRGGRLELGWTFSESLHAPETIRALAGRYLDALRALVAHCTSPGAGGYTPSDFPLAGATQAQLDALFRERGAEVEALYPLSPLQQGMLFHVVQDEVLRPYLVQGRYTLPGALDPALLRAAWRRVAERHAVLRTAFLWEEVDAPLQWVSRTVEIPWHEEDWRGLSPEARETGVARYLAADRARGLDLSEAPLMRFALFRTGESEHRLVWTFSHLLLDGWSTPFVLGEVFALYDAFLRGEEPEPESRRPYADYIAWTQRKGLADAEGFWRRALQGFTAPTPLEIGRAHPGAEGGSAEAHLTVPAGATGALDALARGRGLTLNTLVQGAWALLLSRYSGEDDVLFGALVSGRPAELAGV
ncbi:MAG TPA: condensation domain-containing protein, partial [Longimicrobiaceae bacterium]|nr:condensation domain-containing protein [Longimicrobiaceae bacterium]